MISRERVNALVKEGLDQEYAEELEIRTLQSLLGLLQAGMSLEDVVKNVATEGGATEAGLVELNKAIPILHDTIRAATQRCREMSK